VDYLARPLHRPGDYLVQLQHLRQAALALLILVLVDSVLLQLLLLHLAVDPLLEHLHQLHLLDSLGHPHRLLVDLEVLDLGQQLALLEHQLRLVECSEPLHQLPAACLVLRLLVEAAPK
jgi:hypothetical protein